MTEYEFLRRDGSRAYEFVDDPSDVAAFMKMHRAYQATPVRYEDVVAVPEQQFDARWSAFTNELRERGVTSYCQQVCASNLCRPTRICQLGIDEVTHMPASLELLSESMKRDLEERLNDPFGWRP